MQIRIVYEHINGKQFVGDYTKYNEESLKLLNETIADLMIGRPHREGLIKHHVVLKTKLRTYYIPYNILKDCVVILEEYKRV